MIEKFYCEKCQKIFESKGEKKEWQSSIFGKCWQLIAYCPSCKKECKEYRPSVGSLSLNLHSCRGNCASCSGCVK